MDHENVERENTTYFCTRLMPQVPVIYLEPHVIIRVYHFMRHCVLYMTSIPHMICT